MTHIEGLKAIKEEASVNDVGGGAIPGMGIYPNDKPANWGEPGVSKANQKKRKAKILRRAPPQGLSTGMFWGKTTLKVPDSKIYEARIQKRKGKWWSSYIGEDDIGMAIREWANANPHAPVILEGENTGYIVFARYSKDWKT